MPWGFAAMAAGSAIGSIASSAIQAHGQEKAAQTQEDMFNKIVGQEQPFVQSGYAAEGALNNLLGLTTKDANGNPVAPTGFNGLPAGYLTTPFNPTESDLENYPGYQFQLKQGQLATESGATPGLGAMSGPALKSLMSFNQGLAASNYQNFFNQYQTQQNNIFQRLSGIAGLGQNAAGNMGNAGVQLGTGIAQAQAAAAGSIGAGVGGAAGGLGNYLGAMGIYNTLNNSNVSPANGYSVPYSGSPTGQSTVMDAGPGE